jgi:hypothetical protein
MSERKNKLKIKKYTFSSQEQAQTHFAQLNGNILLHHLSEAKTIIC